MTDFMIAVLVVFCVVFGLGAILEGLAVVTEGLQ